MRYYVLAALIVITVFSCRKKWIAFELAAQNYTGNELRTDGYYYRVAEGNVSSRLFCFYTNGVLLDMKGGFQSNDIAEMDDYLEREFSGAYSLNDRALWGLFWINGTDIKFQHYDPYSGYPVHYYFVNEGVILNDTTFNIRLNYRNDNKERYEVNDIYRFRQYTPKPDSVNSYFP